MLGVKFDRHWRWPRDAARRTKSQDASSSNNGGFLSVTILTGSNHAPLAWGICARSLRLSLQVQKASLTQRVDYLRPPDKKIVCAADC